MATKKAAAKRGETKKLAAATEGSEKLNTIDNEVVTSTTNGGVLNSEVTENVISSKAAGAGRGRKKRKSPTDEENVTDEPTTSITPVEENEMDAESVEEKTSKKGRKKVEKETVVAAVADIAEEKKTANRRGRKPKSATEVEAEVSPKRNAGRTVTKKPKYTDSTDDEEHESKVLNGNAKGAKSETAAKPKAGKGIIVM